MEHLVDQQLKNKLNEVMPNNCDIGSLLRVLAEIGEIHVYTS